MTCPRLCAYSLGYRSNSCMNNEDNKNSLTIWTRDVKLSFLIALGIVLFVAAMIVDSVFLRPREPFSEIDSQKLERELEQLTAATSTFGRWQDKSIFLKRHSGLFVSGRFSSAYEKHQAILILIEALKTNGWRSYSPIPQNGIAVLCKGRYRVYLEWIDSTALLSASFVVKKYKSEPNCP